jgi:hypothetical protein
MGKRYCLQFKAVALKQGVDSFSFVARIDADGPARFRTTNNTCLLMKGCNS